jgi:hypothetical protein
MMPPPDEQVTIARILDAADTAIERLSASQSISDSSRMFSSKLSASKDDVCPSSMPASCKAGAAAHSLREFRVRIFAAFVDIK